jgi:hypothetical protein
MSKKREVVVNINVQDSVLYNSEIKVVVPDDEEPAEEEGMEATHQAAVENGYAWFDQTTYASPWGYSNQYGYYPHRPPPERAKVGILSSLSRLL